MDRRTGTRGRETGGLTMLRHVVLASCLAGFACPYAAAENQIWTSISLDTKPSEGSPYKFELNTELRYQPDGDLDTVEIRPGIAYKLDNGLAVSGGYLYAQSERAGPDQIEHRLWQRVAYPIAKLGSGKLKGQTRLEERWREGADATGVRLRQKFAFEQPVADTPFTLVLSDEVTVGLNDTAWGHAEGFQENRAQAVIEWEMGPATWELGYLNQRRNGGNGADDETNHHIVVGLSASF
ncbi:MAG: DUF2490 domain-containing protein [Hyphomonas sp.]